MGVIAAVERTITDAGFERVVVTVGEGTDQVTLDYVFDPELIASTIGEKWTEGTAVWTSGGERREEWYADIDISSVDTDTLNRMDAASHALTADMLGEVRLTLDGSSIACAALPILDGVELLRLAAGQPYRKRYRVEYTDDLDPICRVTRIDEGD